MSTSSRLFTTALAKMSFGVRIFVSAYTGLKKAGKRYLRVGQKYSSNPITLLGLLRPTGVVTLICYSAGVLSPAFAASEAQRQAAQALSIPSNFRVQASPPPLPTDPIQGVLVQLEETLKPAFADVWNESKTNTSAQNSSGAGRAKVAIINDHQAIAERVVEQIDDLNAKATIALAEFDSSVAHIDLKSLPEEISQRQESARAVFRSRNNELKTIRDRLQKAVMSGKPIGSNQSGAEIGLALRETARFLAKYPNSKTVPSLKSDELSFGVAKRKTRTPFETQSELTAFAQAPLAKGASATKAAVVGRFASPGPADLSETEDIVFTPRLTQLADSLGKNPAKIYDWVRNNIEFVPTFGSTQGSELTLVQKKGNAADISSLLSALLRVSGISTRYVYGTVQVPADRVMNWVGGAKSAEIAQSLLGQGSVPTVAQVSAGKIAAFKLEHVWVEAYLDVSPSRGAINKAPSAWLPLDASYKQYEFVAKKNLATDIPFDIPGAFQRVSDGVSVNSDGAMTQLYPGYISSQFLSYANKANAYLAANPGLTVDEVLGGKKVIVREAVALTGTLPYKVIATSATFATLPDNLRNYATVLLFSSELDRNLDSPSMNQAISLPRLAMRRLSVKYEPATPADAQTLRAAQQSGNPWLPVYLINVKPVLRADDSILATGPIVGMGQPQFWSIDLRGPTQEANSTVSFLETTAGDEMVFGVNGNGVTQSLVEARRGSTTELTISENLHQLALHYWMEYDLLNNYLARQKSVMQQRLLSAGLFSAPLTVRYQFGIPRQGTYSSKWMDVARSIQAVAASDSKASFDFVSVSGMTGSYLESSVIEQLFNRFQGVGKSSAKIFIDAASQQIPIYRIDSSNLSTALAKLTAPADAKARIQNAVAAGQIALAPEKSPGNTYGYLLQDPVTGAGAYLIDGGINGGGVTDCKPEPFPIVQAILFIILTLIILALLAALLAGSAGTAAPAVPALAALMIAFGLPALFYPANAYAGARDPCCEAFPAPHKGGNPVANACADNLPPNEFYGSGAVVDGKNFDAISGNRNILWEMKTNNLNNCTSTFCQSVLLPQWVQSDVAQIQAYSAIARRCMYQFYLGVGDPRYLALLQGAGVTAPGVVDGVVVSAICLQP